MRATTPPLRLTRFARLSLCALAICGLQPAGAAGLLTLTFDDANRTQYEIALPILKEFGLPGTIFVISGKANAYESDPYPWFMGWDQIAEFRDAGWEIGSHSDTHPSLPSVASTEVIRELERASEEIEEHLGILPVSFASPFGDVDARTLDLIMAQYDYHVLARGGSLGRNPLEGTDPARIGRLNVDYTVAPEAVCGEMLLAAKQGYWLVLMFHGFAKGEPRELQTRQADFRLMLSCAAFLAEMGALDIVTLREAMDRVSDN